MLRARLIATQFVREIARSRHNTGMACAGERLARCNDGNRSRATGPSAATTDARIIHSIHTHSRRRCPQSNTAAVAEVGGGEELQQHIGTEEAGGVVGGVGGGGEAAGEEGEQQKEQQKKQLDAVISLVERLNSLKNTNDPHAAEEGLRLLEEGRSRGIKDLRAYNSALRLLSLWPGKGQDISQLARQMNEDGIKPDIDTYNYMIYGYASSKDAQTAQRTFEELKAAGLNENETTLSNLVVAHSWGSFKAMKRIFESIRAQEMTPSRAANYAMISGLRRQEDWQGIRALLHVMLAEGLVPTEPGSAVGFLAARKVGDPELAKTLLARRSQAGLPPRQDFFVNVMVTLSEAERSEEVLEYWRQLVCLQGVGGVDIKPETFFLSLRNAAKANAWDEVEAIIGMMQNDGKPMDEKVHNALLAQRQHMRNPKDAERLMAILAQMERHGGLGLKPLAKLQLAAVCARARMFDKAMPLFEEARSAGVHVGQAYRRAMLETMLSLGKAEEMRTEWQQATYLHKKEFTGSMYHMFMRAAERLNDSDMALELHKESLAGKKANARWFHPIAVQILAGAGRLKEAFGIAETLRTGGYKKLPPSSYQTLCRCCKEFDDKEHMVKVVQTMRKGNLSTYLPPPGVIGFVVEAFTECGQASEVLALFDRMRAQNMQPDPEVYVLLADAAVAADDRSKAALFVDMAGRGGLRASARAVAFAEGVSPPPPEATESAA